MVKAINDALFVFACILIPTTVLLILEVIGPSTALHIILISAVLLALWVGFLYAWKSDQGDKNQVTGENVITSVIVAMSKTNLEQENTQQEHPEIIAEESSSPIAPKTKGRVWGTLGMLYMAAYALHINSVLTDAEVSNFGEAIGKAVAINIFSPFFYCVLAAALLSLISVVGKNKMCILLSLAATIGAAFILPSAIEMLVIPAVMFLISYIRMAK